MNTNKEVHAERSIMQGKIAIYLIQKSKTKSFSAELTMKEVEQGSCIDPSFLLDMTEAQQMIDELWRCGIRPTEGSGSAGSLAATQNHLNDMQKITFMLLERKETT